MCESDDRAESVTVLTEELRVAFFRTNFQQLPRISRADGPSEGVGRQLMKLGSLEEAKVFLEDSVGGGVLIVTCHPIEVLGRALDESQSENIEVILGDVRDYVLCILDVVRKFRQKVVLIDEAALVSFPDEVVSSLNRLRGFRVSISNVSRRERERQHVPALFLAELLLSRHPMLKQIFLEIEAAFLPPVSVDSKARFSNTMDAFRSFQKSSGMGEDLSAKLSSLKKDFVVAARNEAKYSQRNLVLLKELAKLSQQYEDSKRREAQLSIEVARLEGVQEHLKTESAARQRELEAYISKRNFHRARRLTIEAEVAGLRGEIGRIYDSTSWRITAPLRLIKLKFDRLRGK